MTSLTLVTAAIVLYGVVSRSGYGRALALGGATPVGAAAVAGAVAVPTFYAVAVGAAVALVLTLLDRSCRRRDFPTKDFRVPGGRAFVLFAAVGIVVTLASPLLFDGLAVLVPAGPSALAAGVITKSNLAQIVYMVLGISVVFFLARARSASADLIGLAAGLTTLLSFGAWAGKAYGLPFPVGLFDNSPGFAFQNTLPGGGLRVRGILSEPAGLASSSLVTMAFAASRFGSASLPRRLALLAVASMAAYLGAISTSATFWVAGAALLVVVVVVGVVSFSVGRGALGRGAVAGLCLLAAASVWLLPLASATLSEVVEEKLGSSSYNERTGADERSYQLVLDTLGFGVGLGAHRASSFAGMLLACVGVLGTALFVGAVWVVIRGGWRSAGARPAAWALVALLVTKVIAGPDLADTSGILWISLGVLAHAALREEAVQRAARPRGATLALPHSPRRSWRPAADRRSLSPLGQALAPAAFGASAREGPPV